jgi:hypothetical protein
MVRPDPADAARAIAEDLSAQLAIGGPETEQALARMASRQVEGPDLDGLAAAMRRAEAIRDRTRAAASERLSQALNTRVAIHPDTIRRAAAELLAAQDALESAIAAEGRSRRRRQRASWSGGGVGLAAGAALGVAAIPVVGAVVAVVGVAGATVAVRRSRSAEASDHHSLRGHVERCRSRWEQVAGPGADPHDVEEVVHRYDPQDAVVAGLIGESPAVRAAERVALERRIAWVTAWRQEVGDASPIADPTMRDLLERDGTQLWLSGTALAGDEPDTLVVAAPYADLSEERARDLHRQLLALPRGQRVIVVLAPEPGAVDGQLPGAGWARAISS